MEFILASSSPRRKALLEQIGIEAQVVPSDFVEKAEGTVYDLLKHNTLGKLGDVAQKIRDESKVIIAADTIVVIDGEILGKPTCMKQATAMLTKLSGREHSVLTGMAITYKGKSNYQYLTTKVKFKTLSSTEIENYVATGEGTDKAGSYAIQGIGAIFVESVNGCYNNVVGLPINLLYAMLSSRNITIL